MIGTTELIIIGIAVAIFFFGGKKVTDWAKTFGQAKKEYNNAKKEVEG